MARESTISVVVPTLNEECQIGTCIEASRRQNPHEVIVADGGSIDRTRRIAKKKGATVVNAPRGRASQMNAGAERASGDVLLFLHADTLLPPAGLATIRCALHQPTTQSGIFRLRFDRDSPLLRLYGAFTKLPLRQLCFGDRAFFMRRSLFESVGGFPDLPMFEDLEMANMLYKQGGFRFLPQAVTTSARRFDDYGHLTQQLLNAALYAGYFFGVSPHRLARYYDYTDS